MFFRFRFCIPHNLKKEKLFDLIESTFKRKCTLYLACDDKKAYLFSISTDHRRYKLQSRENVRVCDASSITFTLDLILS